MKKVIFLILFALTFISFKPAYASMAFCYGIVCDMPGYNELFKPLSTKLEDSYVNQLNKTFAESINQTNLLRGYNGVKIPKNFQVGIGQGYNSIEKDSARVEGQGYKITNLPNSGFSMSNTFFIGINLGNAITKTDWSWTESISIPKKKLVKDEVTDDEVIKEPAPSFWNRFALYFHLMDNTHSLVLYRKYTKQRDLDGTIKSSRSGFSIRYLLLDELELFPILLDFSGVSLETGFSVLSNTVKADNILNDFLPYDTGNDVQVLKKNSKVNLYSRVETKYIEIRSGIKLFKYIHLFGGLGGYSSNAKDSIEMNWSNTLRYSVQLRNLVSVDPARQFSLQKDGAILLYMKNKSSFKFEKDYRIFGVEFELYNINIVLESFTSKANKTYNLSFIANF